MKKFRVLSVIFVMFSGVLGCGSVPEKPHATQDQATVEKSQNLHSPKVTAPIEIQFEEKEGGVEVRIVARKAARDFEVQINPLDGLQLEEHQAFSPIPILAESAPVVILVKPKEKVGRLGVYATGIFGGKKLGHGQTYVFTSGIDKQKRAEEGQSQTNVITDGDGDFIRIAPAKEK